MPAILGRPKREEIKCGKVIKITKQSQFIYNMQIISHLCANLCRYISQFILKQIIFTSLHTYSHFSMRFSEVVNSTKNVCSFHLTISCLIKSGSSRMFQWNIARQLTNNQKYRGMAGKINCNQPVCLFEYYWICTHITKTGYIWW